MWVAPLMSGGIVISLEILVIEMGDRGSKSLILSIKSSITVKEQRVDGSSVFINNIVRCTLVAGKPVLRRN